MISRKQIPKVSLSNKTPVITLITAITLIINEEYFKIRARITLQKTIERDRFIITCLNDEVSRRERYLLSENIDFLWVFQSLEKRDIAESSFILEELTVGREPLKFSQKTPAVPEKISFQSDPYDFEEIRIENNGLYLLDFTFSVLQHRSLGSFSTSMRRPTKNFKVTVYYYSLPIKKMKHFSFITGEDIPDPLISIDEKSKIYGCEVHGWIMVGSGFVFTWNEYIDKNEKNK